MRDSLTRAHHNHDLNISPVSAFTRVTPRSDARMRSMCWLVINVRVGTQQVVRRSTSPSADTLSLVREEQWRLLIG